jgi:hypothetical protein
MKNGAAARNSPNDRDLFFINEFCTYLPVRNLMLTDYHTWIINVKYEEIFFCVMKKVFFGCQVEERIVRF